MSKKRQRLKPRHRKFLESYAQTGDSTEAYLAAGYKAKTREVARVNGSRLIRNLFETMDYRETMDNLGLDDRRLAEILKELAEHEDPKIRVRAADIISKCRGWQRETLDLGQGAQIVIVQQRPHEIGRAEEAELIEAEEEKPVALLR